MHYNSVIFYSVLLLKSWLFSVVYTSNEPSTEINFTLATTEKLTLNDTTAQLKFDQGLEEYDDVHANSRKPKGMTMDDYHDHFAYMPPNDHHMKEEKKAVQEDPWAGYYDFIINEGSFKFWAAFQLLTALLLIYSAFAAVYYAKFNVITTDYDYYDDFLGRSNNEQTPTSLWSGLSSETFQRIFDAISSKKYA